MKQTVTNEQSTVKAVAQRARQASRLLASLSDQCRREALFAAADALCARSAEIIAANERDTENARGLVAQGEMTAAMFQRLKTSEHGIRGMAACVRGVAELPDPLGRTLATTELDDGLTLYKVTCPLGVIGAIFESRPDVIPQIAALTLKSGNALILKGGSEAAHTNELLVEIWRTALARFDEVPAEAIKLLHTREEIAELLALDHEVDLIVPRGSREFVDYIAKHSRIPVLGHGEGICHVYIDAKADLPKAIGIIVDSKTQYPAACNSAETLLIHAAVADDFLPALLTALTNAGVEIRACPRTIALAPNAASAAANERDWSTEYSDLIISVKVVDDLDQAIGHVNKYGSRHTEVIVTEDPEAAARFMDKVDAASVFHNASSRFADGFRYGFGAELGISNGKLHARGPVGLEGLTTYKFKLFGDGHQVAPYSTGQRRFKHETARS
jgi:glutamate-5-semialdehyde dehydrogenase